MVLPILQDGDETLRQMAEPVPEGLFGTPELKKIVADMAETMDKEPDGVAIAAPQVGMLYRLFLVRYDRMRPAEEGEDVSKRLAELGVYVNPKITKASRRAAEVDEGCLSVRGLYGKTVRKEQATVEAWDENGIKFARGGGGILAQAFQHEIDHLDGILFIDHATELWKPKTPADDEPAL